MLTLKKFLFFIGLLVHVAHSWAQGPMEVIKISGHSVEDKSFVGGGSCKQCHEKEYSAWQKSHHDLAMQEANKNTVLGDFNNRTFEYNGIVSKFYKRKGKYYVRTDGPDGKLKEFLIAYTFGVTPLQQYLIAFPDGRLQALSIAWDSRSKKEGGQRWFHLYPDEKISYDDVLHWTGTAHNWNLRCAECHSTNYQKNFSLTENRYKSTWSELNVSCEACHGPGKTHVKWAETGMNDKLKDKGLVVDLIAKGTWELQVGATVAQHKGGDQNRQQIEGCGRCHARRSVIGEYVHGKQLLDTHMPTLLSEDLYHVDGQILNEVYVYGSFLQSKMFAAGVTCTNCHEPHSLKLKVEGNGLCAQCHQAQKYDLPKHHFHKADSTGAQCVNCHMPAKTYMVVDPRRDHSIRVPRPDLSDKLGSPNACNQCHQKKTSKWAAETVKRWYGNKPAESHYGEQLATAREGREYASVSLSKLANDRSRSDIIRATALERLQVFSSPTSIETAQLYISSKLPLMRIAALRVLQLLPIAQRYQFGSSLLSDPVLAVRVEAARVLAGTPAQSLSPEQKKNLGSAIAEYINAQRLSADDAIAHVNLSNIYLRLSKFDQAETELLTARKLNPYFVPAMLNLADLYRAQNQEAKSESLLRQAIKIAPDSADAYHALGLLLVRARKHDQALESLKKATTLAINNSRYGYIYGIALHSLGKNDEAIRHLKKVEARHPTDRDTLTALVTIYRDSGDARAAMLYAEELLAQWPSDRQVHELYRQIKTLVDKSGR